MLHLNIAPASGLYLVAPEQRNPLLTTYGTGELIKAALEKRLNSMIKTNTIKTLKVRVKDKYKAILNR